MYLYEDKKTQEDNIMFTNFNFQQILSAFIVLFAVIDIIGAIPIIIDLKDKGIYLIRKFFGIILLAISVKLFMSNITLLMEQIEASTKAI